MEALKLADGDVSMEASVDLKDSEFSRRWIASGMEKADPEICFYVDIDGDYYTPGRSGTVALDIEEATALRDWLNGALAQMEERRALNAEASGSNPERAAK